MTRKDVRTHAFKIIFQLKFFKPEVVLDKMDLYFENMNVKKYEDKAEIMVFVKGVVDDLTNIDNTINKQMKGWKTTRVPAADLSILRLATFEMLHSDLSIKIIANEAVELAKTFSTDDSPSFINAILGQIHNNL